MPLKTDRNFKVIAMLLLIAVASSVVGNLYTVTSTEKLLQTQQVEFDNLLEHRAADRQHINDTATTLEILREEIARTTVANEGSNSTTTR